VRRGGKLKFKTHAKFAAAVAAAHAGKATTTKKTQTVADVVAKVKAWCPIFCPGTHRRARSGKGARGHLTTRGMNDDKVPGDAEATEFHATAPQTVKMFEAEPCTIQASLQSKYPFQKDALVRAWRREAAKKKFRRVTVRDRAECMRRVLVDVAHQLGTVTEAAQRGAHDFLGKRVSRVQGPVQFLRSYGILTKVTKRWIATQKRSGRHAWKRSVIRVGKRKDTLYRICASPVERAAAVKKLMRMVAASPVIQGIVDRCAEDLDGCHRLLDASFAALDQIRAPMLSKTKDDYNRRWTCRGAVITGLSIKGKTLQAGSATVGSLLDIFPDVGNWILRVSRHFYHGQNAARAAKVPDLLKKMRYTGKIEHLSMWLCFFSNSDLIDVSPAIVKRKAPELLTLMRTIRKSSTMWPTPMVLVQEARAAGIL